MLTNLGLYIGTVAGMLLLAALLHLLKRLGAVGRAMSAAVCRAPMLDVVVLSFTVLPPIVGVVWGTAQGSSLGSVLVFAVMGVLGQLTALWVWIIAHEISHRGQARGPRIAATLNRIVGPVRNHLAVWWTAWAVPVFALIRVAELFVYPPLIWLVKFPRYKHGEWINVSRMKFNGLVGYDLIWCLYCDWMTGVWSLGGEMLRNVESFWCPIRFSSPEKCENCKVDFPDINGGWTRADGTMHDVVNTLDSKYPGPGVKAWFGHPARLTVKGKPVGRE